MQHILYINTARRLGLENDCLLLTSADEENLTIHFEDIAAVVVESIYCQITTPALLLCMEKGIPFILCNEKHHPTVYCLNLHRHTELLDRITQQIAWSKELTQKAWLKILYTKLQHQLDLLDFFKPGNAAIGQIQAYKQTLSPIISENEINTAESISARLYFLAMFGGEFKRLNYDVINHALNYGYAIVRSQIMNTLTIKGLHPALGIWHHSIRNRFNLADDLIEILRPLVDHKVYTLNLVDEFSKNHKERMLSILYANVFWQKHPYSLKQAINLYVEEFMRFMNEQSSTLDLIELRINAYESN